MPQYKTIGDWKENIVTNPPEKEEGFDANRFAKRCEIKSKIVNIVIGRNGMTEQKLVDRLSYPEGLVRELLEELRDEDVLEVEKV